MDKHVRQRYAPFTERMLERIPREKVPLLKQILKMAGGGGYLFKLDNGLSATIYQLSNPKMRAVAETCRDPPEAFPVRGLTKPDRHHFIALEVKISKKKLYLIYSTMQSPKKLIDGLLRDPIEVFDVAGYYIIFEDTAYPASGHTAKLLLSAIQHKIDPTVGALLY